MDYDACGNMVYQEDNGEGLKKQMHYDAFNRISEVRDPDSGRLIGEYHYDDGGFRVRKLARRMMEGEEKLVEVLYPSMYFGIETQRTYEGQEIPDTSYAVNNIYVNGIRVAAVIPSGAARYYHTDQVDSVKVVTDDAGMPVSRFEYLPYGETWVEETADDVDEEHNPKFNSQELDRETNFYYYNARHYDPVICRFVTADTVVDGEGSAFGWNRYMYVHGNPVMYRDPTGHNAVILQATTGADFVGGATKDRVNAPAGHTGVLQEYKDKNGNTKWMYFSRNQKLAKDGSLKAGSYNVHNESFDTPEQFFQKQAQLVEERNKMEKIIGKIGKQGLTKAQTKRYDYLENFTYFDKQKEEARARYDQGIQIKTTPEQDKKLLKYFKDNQDTSYRLFGTNNISLGKRIAAYWLSGGVAALPMLIGSLNDSNNCKDLIRRGLNKHTNYQTEDSIKPNNWYNDFKEKYRNDIVKEYKSDDFK